jgi:uncharacterized protein
MNAEATVRALYDRIGRGDIAAALTLIAADAEFVQAGSLPFGGTWTGRDGFQRMAAGIFAAWPEFTAAPRTYLTGGAEHVAVLARLTAKGLDMDMLELWQVREGQIVRCQPFYFDTAAAVAKAQ